MAIIQEEKDRDGDENQQAEITKTPGDSGAPSVTQINPQQKSGLGQRFVNLRKYMTQNVQPQMAEKIQANIGAKKSDIESNIGEAQNRLTAQKQQESSRLQQGQSLLKDNLLTDTEKLKAFSGVNVGTTPAQEQASWAQQYGSTPEERQAFFEQLAQGGRQSFTVPNQENTAEAINKLSETARGLETQQGRFNMLQEIFGGPQYSSGQQQLDQLLLQTQPEQYRKLREIKAIAEPLQQRFSDLQKQVGETESSTAQQAAALQSKIGQELPEQMSEIEKAAYQSLEDNAGKPEELVSALRSGFAQTGAVTQEQLDLLNQAFEKERSEENLQKAISEGLITPELAEQIKNFKFTSGMGLYGTGAAGSTGAFLNAADQEASLSSVMTPEDAARYLALSKLGQQENLLGISNEDAFGSFDPNSITGSLGQAVNIQKARNAFSQQYEPLEKAQQQEDRAWMISNGAMGVRRQFGFNPQAVDKFIQKHPEYAQFKNEIRTMHTRGGSYDDIYWDAVEHEQKSKELERKKQELKNAYSGNLSTQSPLQSTTGIQK